MFILADVNKERAGRTSQCAVIAFVFDAQIFDGVVDSSAHDQSSLRKVELVKLSQEVLVLRVFLVAIFNKLNYSLDLC